MYEKDNLTEDQAKLYRDYAINGMDKNDKSVDYMGEASKNIIDEAPRDNLEHEYSIAVHDYTRSIDELEIMKEETEDIELIDKIDDFIKEIKDRNDYYLQNENEEVAIESKDNLMTILQKNDKSYDELKRDFQFDELEYNTNLETDKSLAISGNENTLEKYNISKDLDEIDIITEIEYKDFHSRPEEYHEVRQDLKTYDENMGILKRNNYSQEYLNEVDNHNSNLFKKNLFKDFKNDVLTDNIKTQDELKEKNSDYKKQYEVFKNEFTEKTQDYSQDKKEKSVSKTDIER